MKTPIIFFFLLLTASLAIAQNRIVSGTVTGVADGRTIPGVTIMEKGTVNGTVTDSKGYYSLKINNNAKTLVFSFMGMKTVEIAVKDSDVINAQLEDEKINLEEVVVIGYGAVKKSDLTGSVASIRAEDLKRIPVNSLDQGLQGKVSGVQVTQLSSQPGGAMSVRIRGGNSIMAGNEPLYVIDGVLIESQVDMSWIGSPSQNGLSSINPNDIESMEILKDASATSIYGARGANGVVLITTKRGKAGKDNLNFETYLGCQKNATDVEEINCIKFAKL